MLEGTKASGPSGSQCTCGRERHVLLVGAADLRHILKAMSSSSTSTHVGSVTSFIPKHIFYEVEIM